MRISDWSSDVCSSDLLAEDVEIGDTLGPRPRQHRGDERLPEFGVHMPRSIDAKAIDSEPVDPRSVDLDHSRHDARIFGHHVIEPDEIAHRRAFARRSKDRKSTRLNSSH